DGDGRTRCTGWQGAKRDGHRTTPALRPVPREITGYTRDRPEPLLRAPPSPNVAATARNRAARMYLNTFAPTTQPLDMTQTDEFRSLLASAADLGIPHSPAVPYWSRN